MSKYQLQEELRSKTWRKIEVSKLHSLCWGFRMKFMLSWTASAASSAWTKIIITTIKELIVIIFPGDENCWRRRDKWIFQPTQ